MAKQAKKKTGAKKQGTAKKSAGGKKTAAAKKSAAKKPPAKKPAKGGSKTAALKKSAGGKNPRAAAKPAKAPSTKAQRATPPQKVAKPATAEPITHDDVNERADAAAVAAGAQSGAGDASVDDQWVSDEDTSSSADSDDDLED